MTDYETNVHFSHCNQGEYQDSCKYGENETCPVIENVQQSAVTDEKRKAFWRGFELSKAFPDRYDIQTFWNEYHKLSSENSFLQSTPAVKDGYKLVPFEPTYEMWDGLARGIVM